MASVRRIPKCTLHSIHFSQHSISKWKIAIEIFFGHYIYCMVLMRPTGTFCSFKHFIRSKSPLCPNGNVQVGSEIEFLCWIWPVLLGNFILVSFLVKNVANETRFLFSTTTFTSIACRMNIRKIGLKVRRIFK